MARTKKERKAATFMKELQQDAPLIPRDKNGNTAIASMNVGAKKAHGVAKKPLFKPRSQMAAKGAAAKNENHLLAANQNRTVRFGNNNNNNNNNEALKTKPKAQKRGAATQITNERRLTIKEMRERDKEMRERAEHQRRREARQVHSDLREMNLSRNTSYNIFKDGSPAFSPLKANSLLFSPELVNPSEDDRL